MRGFYTPDLNSPNAAIAFLAIIATIVTATIAALRLLYKDGKKANDLLLKAEHDRIDELKKHKALLEKLLGRGGHDDAGNGD